MNINDVWYPRFIREQQGKESFFYYLHLIVWILGIQICCFKAFSYYCFLGISSTYLIVCFDCSLLVDSPSCLGSIYQQNPY